MPLLYQQQPKEIAITHHLAILKHHHCDYEYNVDNNNYNNNIKNTVSATHTQERSISSPYSNSSGIQYYQLSKILFFSNPSQPSHSSLLRTTRCGILLNHRITAFQQHLASITEWMPSKANLCFLLSGSDPPIVELEFCALGSQTGTLNPAALPKVTEVILLHQHAIIKLIKCHPGDILLPWTNAAH